MFCTLLLALPVLTFSFVCGPSSSRPFTLTVVEQPPFPYGLWTKQFAPFLEAGSYAIHSDGVWYTADAGLTPGAPTSGTDSEGALGSYSYFSIPWSITTGLNLTTTFKCFSSGAIEFETFFPQGLPAAATLPAPSIGTKSLTPNFLPSTHFPSFSAAQDSALRSEGMGFAEWYEVMSGDKALVGRGLSGYRGGQLTGPLLLFNASFVSGGKPPFALTLGPMDGFSSTMLAVVDDPSSPPPPPPRPACDVGQANTDQTGAVHSPGYDNGARTGSPAACCALCSSLGAAACNAWVFDTSGSPSPAADCWPCMGARGSKPAANRTLGWTAPPPLRLVGGVSGYITELPPVHTVRFALMPSAAGASDAMYAYGLLLRTAHGTQRVDKTADAMRRKISYWTDNGAYYEDDCTYASRPRTRKRTFAQIHIFSLTARPPPPLHPSIYLHRLALLF